MSEIADGLGMWVYGGIAGSIQSEPRPLSPLHHTIIEQPAQRVPRGTAGFSAMHGTEHLAVSAERDHPAFVMIQETSPSARVAPALQRFGQGRDSSASRVTIAGCVRSLPAGGSSPPAALQDLVDQLGPAALPRIDGEYIIAYASPERQEMLIFRSVTCPLMLYYRRLGGRFLWATNPLFLFSEGRPALHDVNADALPALVLRLRDAPAESVYRDIATLPPGNVLRIADGSASTHVLSDFDLDDNRGLPLESAANRLKEHVHRAVTTCLAPAGSMAVAFSGGIDSAVVCHEVVGLGRPVQPIHWTARGGRVPGSETEAARTVSASLGLSLREVDVSPALRPHGQYLQCHDDCYLPHNLLGPELGLARASAGTSSMYWGAFADQLFESQVPSLLSWHPLSVGSVWRAIPQVLLAVPGTPGSLGLLMSLFQGFRRPCRGLLPRHEARAEGVGAWLSDDAREWAIRCLTRAFQARRDQYDASTAAGRQSASSALTYVAIKDSIDAQTNNAIHYDVMLPYGLMPVFPFLHRPLIEFCLSLSHQHKVQMYMNVPVRKVVLRYAYAPYLPRPTVSSELSSSLLAFAQEFCRNNIDTVGELLGDGSLLQQMGVIDGRGLAATLAEERLYTMDSGPLLDACVAELWLNRLVASPG